ncbi:methanethiol S-methyltransferase [Phenylobacterium sp.]|jgi:protein-S-isoprenylcysteine O-methyltransferase Ste14|uniref:methanethiol S-methyltransferase n=1 Tax=Phenylobacterium sp. TaxID=1871053 RepID=UPI002F9241A2
MRGLPAALYSAVVYLFFFATFLYAAGFVEGVVVPKAIDTGPEGPLLPSLMIDVALLGLFAVQHSLMARPAFKRAWTRLVPPAVERSTYVLAASLALALLFWQWRPLLATVWTVEDPAAALALTAVSWAGWGMVLVSTFLISHFHLFGLSQGFAKMLGRGDPEFQLTTPLFYKWIRHPIYAGFIVAFWATPQMSLGHLLFAVATTGYILIGIWLEERDLVGHFGGRYVEYRRNVGMLFPKLRLRPGREAGLP